MTDNVEHFLRITQAGMVEALQDYVDKYVTSDPPFTVISVDQRTRRGDFKISLERKLPIPPQVEEQNGPIRTIVPTRIKRTANVGNGRHTNGGRGKD